ncbi:MAG: copper resistance D family protein, partial [Actinomycetota bacterium]
MIFEIANTGAEVMVIAALVSMSFLLPERDGFLTSESDKTRRALKIASISWVITSIGNFLATLSQIFDSPISQVLKGNVIRSFATQVTLGKLLALQIAIALLVVVCARLVKKNGGAIWLLIAAFAGMLAPVFQSHSSALGSHGLAIGSLVIHVAGLALWIGSVVALLMMSGENRSQAFSRVSTIALWSSTAVVLSGVINAWTRLRLTDGWFTSYGALISLKILLTLLVLVIASRLRKNISVNRL